MECWRTKNDAKIIFYIEEHRVFDFTTTSIRRSTLFRKVGFLSKSNYFLNTLKHFLLEFRSDHVRVLFGKHPIEPNETRTRPEALPKETKVGQVNSLFCSLL